MIQFQENAGRKDGQTLFHRTLPTNAEGPRSDMRKKYLKGIETFQSGDSATIGLVLDVGLVRMSSIDYIT